MGEARRVIIADDDLTQLEEMVTLVSQLRPDWQIVATAGDVDSVVAATEKFAPEILLLDIHMPGADDVGWVSDLPLGVAIVFVTGDPNCAVQAFESSAVDYVVKPVTPLRLSLALDRAFSGSRSSPPAVLSEPFVPLLWLTASSGPETLVISVDDIYFLQSDKKYTRVTTKSREGLVRSGISGLQRRLDPRVFVRIHRGALLNMKHVHSVRKDLLGRMRVHLIDRPESLLVSKPFEHIFRAF